MTTYHAQNLNMEIFKSIDTGNAITLYLYSVLSIRPNINIHVTEYLQSGNNPYEQYRQFPYFVVSLSAAASDPVAAAAG